MSIYLMTDGLISIFPMSCQLLGITSSFPSRSLSIKNTHLSLERGEIEYSKKKMSQDSGEDILKTEGEEIRLI